MGDRAEIDLQINQASGIPIYVQLKEAIKHWILVGKYPPGSQLPTVRQLAVALKINPNTVARVYSELESEGVLATRQGRGTFVKETDVLPSDAGRKELKARLEQLLKTAYELGYSVDDVRELIDEIVSS